MPLLWEISASGPLKGAIRPQSDKSLTHRALLFGGIGDGKTTIKSPLLGDDCLATAECLKQMGVQVRSFEARLEVNGKQNWDSPEEPLDCGNSGTTARLISGIIASQEIIAIITGDESLKKRPMKRVTGPLREMGALIEGDSLPIKIDGGNLRPIEYDTPVASAQIKSCLLLASLRGTGEMIIHEPAKSRDHTERLLKALGADIVSMGRSIKLKVPFEIPAFEISIPGDISSAAFFMVAAAIVPESAIVLKDVGINPTRSGIIDVFKQIGCKVIVLNEILEMGEPRGDLLIEFPDTPDAFYIEGHLVPRLIDEIPVLAVLATQCHGTTVVKDAAEVRVKESDRLKLMANALNQMGANIKETPDGLIIKGPTPLNAIEFDAHLDHRIAMSLMIAGLIAKGTMRLTGVETVSSSYPDFLQHLGSLQEDRTFKQVTFESS